MIRPAKNPKETPKNGPFEMSSLEKADAPTGAEGKNWYRDVINQGVNEIVGYRQGSRKTVSKEVEEIIVSLNERRRGKSGRVHLTPSPRKRK